MLTDFNMAGVVQNRWWVMVKWLLLFFSRLISPFQCIETIQATRLCILIADVKVNAYLLRNKSISELFTTFKCLQICRIAAVAGSIGIIL